MSPILCPTCFDPTQDGLACAVCTSKLRKALSDLQLFDPIDGFPLFGDGDA